MNPLTAYALGFFTTPILSMIAVVVLVRLTSRAPAPPIAPHVPRRRPSPVPTVTAPSPVAPLRLGDLSLVGSYLRALPPHAVVTADMARRLLATVNQRAAESDALEALLRAQLTPNAKDA
jgi:hypothetical protein